MVEAPDALRPWLREFACVVHDLGEIAPRRLSRTPEVRAGLLALKVAYAQEVEPELLDLMTGGPVAGSGFERHIIRYIAERMNLTLERLEGSLRRTKPERWEALMGTVAEAWLEQGRAEGVEQGRAGIVARQLELRFGALPEAVRARVRGASADELEA